MLRSLRWLWAAAWLLAVGTATAQPEAHWALAPAQLEKLLADGTFEIKEVHGGVGGVMGVKRLTMVFPAASKEFYVKWKRAPQGTFDGWNNTPRKEIAAYEIQKWFLDPDDYVVPTTVPRCIPLDVYHEKLDAITGASFEGTQCVAGVLVVWIYDVTVPEELYDEERFEHDPRYAYHMANFNLLTYLIEHEDGREGNFLVATDESDRRVFSIDNGVSFGALVKNFFVRNWHKIRVPALRKETIERLRRVTPEQMRQLGVLGEMRANDRGILVSVEPGENADPEEGVRTKPGWVQFGLTQDEIEDLQKRVEKLLADVDSGHRPVF